MRPRAAFPAVRWSRCVEDLGCGRRSSPASTSSAARPDVGRPSTGGVALRRWSALLAAELTPASAAPRDVAGRPRTCWLVRRPRLVGFRSASASSQLAPLACSSFARVAQRAFRAVFVWLVVGDLRAVFRFVWISSLLFRYATTQCVGGCVYVDIVTRFRKFVRFRKFRVSGSWRHGRLAFWIPEIFGANTVLLWTTIGTLFFFLTTLKANNSTSTRTVTQQN